MGLLYLAAGLCSFTLGVHAFVGQRLVVRPLLQHSVEPFARTTLLVVWHMISWTLALSALALGWAATESGENDATLQQALAGARVAGLFVALLSAGYALLFLVAAQRLLSAAIRLPQWILFGATSVFSLAGCLGGQRAAHMASAGLVLTVAVVHVAWALGLNWPADSRQQLSLSVAGRNELPSAASCGTVALGLGAMALLLLAPVPSWLRLAIAGIFVLRGTLGFVEPWLRREIVGTPYLLYSRYMYTPLSLCIGIAAGMSV